MKHRKQFTRLAALVMALLMTLALAPAAGASATTGMGNFKKVRDYTGFADVAESAWYAKDVRKAYELGLVNGKSGNKFDPEGSLNLAEAITMAVNVCNIYFDLGFKDGGSPWYQNAVDCALEWGIIPEDGYKNYEARATRADVARMFANALPGDEFGRINRIAWIPDVTSQTPYVSYIYTLYNAGVVTGDNAGLFRPDDNISRAEAAAIINRVALPNERKQIALTTHAPGQVVTAADGSFQISVPKNPEWKVLYNVIDTNSDGYSRGYFFCDLHDWDASFYVETFVKSEWNATLKDMVEAVRDSRQDEGNTLIQDIVGSWTRGMTGYAFIDSFTGSDDRDYTTFVSGVETSRYIVIIRMEWCDDCSEEDYDSLSELLMGFDLSI